MNTPFSQIYDRFLYYIKDYKLDSLAKTNITATEKYLKGVLISAMPLYSRTFEYDDIMDEFNTELTQAEQNILAMCMLEVWFEKDTNDTQAMDDRMRGRDLKGESTAQILKQKTNRLATIMEKRDALIVEEQAQRIKEQL